jgi:putative hydrolase of the HAD superfamily
VNTAHQGAPDPAAAARHVDGVLFDIDDTLVDFTGAARRALVDAVRRHLGEVPEADVIAAWEEVAEPGYARFTSGELGFAEMLTERTRAFVVALAHRDATTDIHVAIENDRTGRIFDHYRLFDDVRPELRRLRAAGLRVGAVSNSDGDYQRRKLATVGLADEFDAAVFSGDLGVAKPDPAIFLAGAAALDTEPGRTVYVGDRWDVDAKGALAAGLIPVWLDRAGVGSPVAEPRISRIVGLPELAAVLHHLSAVPQGTL